jgi:ABC-type dipeptide/oligopeptide/nickel transport system ATPase subunit
MVGHVYLRSCILWATVLAPVFLDKFPFELSGGQRPHAANAYAPAVRPALLIADKAGSLLSRMDQWDVRCLFSLDPESGKG